MMNIFNIIDISRDILLLICPGNAEIVTKVFISGH